MQSFIESAPCVAPFGVLSYCKNKGADGSAERGRRQISKVHSRMMHQACLEPTWG